MKLSLIIAAIDKATAPIKKIKASTRGLAREGLDKVTTSAGRASRALDRLGVTSVARKLREIGAAAAVAGGRGGLRLIEVGARATATAAQTAVGWLGRLTLAAGRYAVGATIAGGAIAAYTGGNFIGSIIGTAGAFEQYQVVLENTEGSAAAARKAMEWVKEFGKTTPYEVGEVMEAFVRLKAYGMDPMNGMLRSLGNTASGMGKRLMDAVEMIADASTGEFERIKEFGIKAKTKGNEVTFAYTKNGKQLKKTAKNNAVAIQAALRAIMDERFPGMMERQSHTVIGLWSNIKDQLANFQLDTADAGFFDFVKGKLQELLDWINAKAADGSLKVWAKQLSDGLVQAGKDFAKFAQETDWRQVGADIMEVARGVIALTSALAGLIGRIRSIGSGVADFFSFLPAWDRGLDKWSKRNFGRPFGIDSGAGEPYHRPLRGTGRAVAPGSAFRPSPGPIKPGAQPLAPMQWPRRTGATPMTQWPEKLPDVGGKVSLQVDLEPGLKSKLIALKANPNTEIDVSRGRVMPA